jgi:hypothetical protein
MEAVTRDSNDKVSGRHFASGKLLRRIDNARHAADDVNLFVVIDPWHFGSLTSDQGATQGGASIGGTPNDLVELKGRKAATPKIVDKEKRACPLAQEVVRAVVHDVGADV